MPEILTSRLSEPVSEPELSKWWESERTTFTAGTGDGIDTWISAPELVLTPRGNDVELSFPAGGEKGHERLKCAFERAVHRYRPGMKVEWR